MKWGQYCLRWRAAIVLAAVVAVGSASIEPATAGPLNDYDLIVFGDLTTSSEVEGKTFVGGNLSGTSNYGTKLTIPSSTVSLQVGGSITSGNIQLNAGSLQVAGNISANVNMNSQGNYAVGGTISGNVNGGTHIPLTTPA